MSSNREGWAKAGTLDQDQSFLLSAFLFAAKTIKSSEVRLELLCLKLREYTEAQSSFPCKVEQACLVKE